jgi:anti-anti-sigma factor
VTAAELLVDGARLACQGPLTYHTVTQLHRDLLQAIEESKATALELDLSAAEEIDSSGIALLVVARMAAERRSVAIQITGLGEQVLSLARLYGVADIIRSAAE